MLRSLSLEARSNLDHLLNLFLLTVTSYASCIVWEGYNDSQVGICFIASVYQSPRDRLIEEAGRRRFARSPLQQQTLPTGANLSLNK